MIKLFTFNDISSNSSEALFKIVLQLDKYGLAEENVYQLDNSDIVFEEAKTALAAGDFVILAAEKSDFLAFKFDFMSQFLLKESPSANLTELVLASFRDAGEDDLESHLSLPVGSTLHASDDGLYSGFSVELINGLCTVLPLDFTRLDDILLSYIGTYFDPSLLPEAKIEIHPNEEELYHPDETSRDVKESVAKMIYSLIQVDKTIAIANSEAALHIYNLYDKIQGLSEVTSFVEIVDPEEEEETPAEEVRETSFVPDEGEVRYEPVLDDEGNQIYNEEGEPVFEAIYPSGEPVPAPQKEESKKSNMPKETASEKTIRHAREAMRNMNSTFGAAISEIYSATDENGERSFFVFVAIGDGKTVKAKKIGTTSEAEAEDLIFHAITVLCETVCQKIDAINQSIARAEAERKKAEEAAAAAKKKANPTMIAVTALIFLVAIISAILLARSAIKPETTQAPPSLSTENTMPSADSTTESTSESANNILPSEPPASEVSASQTSAVAPSTSGKFTFYVFGYGHGVGLSQTGANYYAKQGWTYAQILANYYYGTTLMSGDSYPETITYSGTAYPTRDFIAGSIEGEMGGSYSIEALKAQAVAIYTFAKYYNYNLDTASMAYKPSPSSSCYTAADFVIDNGLYIAYNGMPALTPFHAMSAGRTTSYYNVWGGTALNYLSGGRPSFCDYLEKDYKTTVTMKSDELKSLIEGNDSSISLSGDPSTWISILTHDSAVSEDIGYVSAIRVGGKEYSGNEFRTKLMSSKLRSHCFTFTYTPDGSNQ